MQSVCTVCHCHCTAACSCLIASLHTLSNSVLKSAALGHVGLVKCQGQLSGHAKRDRQGDSFRLAPCDRQVRPRPSGAVCSHTLTGSLGLSSRNMLLRDPTGRARDRVKGSLQTGKILATKDDSCVFSRRCWGQHSDNQQATEQDQPTAAALVGTRCTPFVTLPAGGKRQALWSLAYATGNHTRQCARGLRPGHGCQPRRSLLLTSSLQRMALSCVCHLLLMVIVLHRLAGVEHAGDGR